MECHKGTCQLSSINERWIQMEDPWLSFWYWKILINEDSDDAVSGRLKEIDCN